MRKPYPRLKSIHPLATDLFAIPGLEISIGANLSRGTIRVWFDGETAAIRKAWRMLPDDGSFVFYVDKSRYPGCSHACIEASHKVSGFPSLRRRKGDRVFRMLWDNIPWPGCMRDASDAARIARSLGELRRRVDILLQPS